MEMPLTCSVWGVEQGCALQLRVEASASRRLVRRARRRQPTPPPPHSSSSHLTVLRSSAYYGRLEPVSNELAFEPATVGFGDLPLLRREQAHHDVTDQQDRQQLEEQAHGHAENGEDDAEHGERKHTDDEESK